MVVHICPKCHHEFFKKSSYDYHINKKTPCTGSEQLCISFNENNSINDQDSDKICPNCGKVFARKYNVVRHLEYTNCKSTLRKEIDRLNTENNTIKSEMTELKKIVELSSLSSNGLIRQPIINNQINIGNLVFVVFKEHKKYDELNYDEIMNSVGKVGSGIFKQLVTYNHLNDRLPGQQNILIDDRSGECKVIAKENTVEIMPVDEVVDKLINNSADDIEKILEEYHVCLNDENIKKLQENIKIIRNREEIGNKEFIRVTKNNIADLLYENRYKIKHTWQNCGIII